VRGDRKKDMREKMMTQIALLKNHGPLPRAVLTSSSYFPEKPDNKQGLQPGDYWRFV
jgi:hypothetical protein